MRKPLTTHHSPLTTISLPSYNGGKSGDGVYQTIINHIPPVRNLIIGCLGHCGVLKNILPAPGKNIGIDLDPAVIATWQALALPWLDLRCEDIIQYLETNADVFAPGTLIYLDPPYLFETRKGKRNLYNFEWNRDQHERLLKIATVLRCMILISCYDNPIYQNYLSGWNKTQFIAQTRRGPATETLYFNYPFPDQLHDYRYIGKDYRERENISRKIKRHISKLKALPVLERNAILYALNNKASDMQIQDRAVCPGCQKTFNPRTARTVYCSDACRNRAFRRK